MNFPRWQKFKLATKLCHFPENTHNRSDKWFSNNLLTLIKFSTNNISNHLCSLSEGQSRSFYNPSTRSKLKSFEDMTHKTKLKCRSGDTVNPELVFSRELVLANCREDKISTTTNVNWKQEIWFFTKLSAISSKVLNLFAFIDCNKGMSSLIRVAFDWR
jgi:hypothetical protein